MNDDVFIASPVQASQLVRCEVLRMQVDGTVVVSTPDASTELLCDQLVLSRTSTVRPEPGEIVLVSMPQYPGERGVLIGRVAVAASSPCPPDGPPEELLLEATQSLTLRVGDGSITIRADGKILIKGKDLVSHAQRVNRIKGGSVAIN